MVILLLSKPYFHGPYSDELVNDVQALMGFGIVEEKVEATEDGYTS